MLLAIALPTELIPWRAWSTRFKAARKRTAPTSAYPLARALAERASRYLMAEHDALAIRTTELGAGHVALLVERRCDVSGFKKYELSVWSVRSNAPSHTATFTRPLHSMRFSEDGMRLSYKIGRAAGQPPCAQRALQEAYITLERD